MKQCVSRFSLLAGLLLLAGCDNGQRVERPLADVHATLASLPADANAMSLATAFPGTDYYVQPDGGRVIWHFRHNGQDYGRFIATMTEDGPRATIVSTDFEKSSDAAIADKLDFLRDMARVAGEASVSAALTGRPVDRAALERQFQEKFVNDPMAASVATFGTVSAEMDRYIKEEKEREARDAPAHVKPGVLPEVGGARERRRREGG